jgi:citrate synthase
MLSKSKQAKVKSLDKNRNIIRSKTGGWFPGKGVFSHGYSMLDELVGEKSYFQIMILNATGKLVERPLADWIEAIYGCLSWPDPRIWCNQIGALAGEAKTSVIAATTAGALAADSRSYGGRTLIEGMMFIQNSYEKFSNGQSVTTILEEEIKKHGGKPHITGFARPLAKGDERLEAMERVSQKLNFTEGKHLKLAYDIEEYLLLNFDEGMNINGYISAFLSDQGFTVDEVYQIFSMMVMSGVTACYLEQQDISSNPFLPLRCDDIEYTGKNYRELTND